MTYINDRMEQEDDDARQNDAPSSSAPPPHPPPSLSSLSPPLALTAAAEIMADLETNNILGSTPPLFNKERRMVTQYIESVQFFIYKTPIINWFISVYFFLFLILNTSMCFLIKSDKNGVIFDLTSNRFVTFVDIIDYIISLSPSKPAKDEIQIAQLFGLICIGSVLIFVLLHFFVNSLKVPFTRICFSILWGYVFPFSYFLFANIINKGNIFNYKNVNTFESISTICQLLISLLFICGGIFNCSSPLVINSPFFAKDEKRSFYLCLYFCFFSMVNLHHHDKSMMYVRSVVAFIVSLCVIAKPPYFSIIMNFMLLVVTFYEASCPICSMFYELECFYCLIASVVLAIMVNLIIFFIIIRRSKKGFAKKNIDRVKHLCYIGRRKKARKIMEKINVLSLERDDYNSAIRLALTLKPNNAREIISHFSNLQDSISEIFFVWSAKNALKMISKDIVHQDEQIIQKSRDNVERLYNEFWHRVWLSDTSSLLKLSVSLGREQRLKELYVYHHFQFCPKIINLLDEDTKKIVQNNIQTSFFKKTWANSTFFDFFLLFTFAFFMLSNSMLLIVSRNLRGVLPNYYRFEYFENKVYHLFSSYFKTNSSGQSLNDINNSLHDLISNEADKKINQYLLESTNFLNITQRFIECSSKNNNELFFANCYPESVNLFYGLYRINSNPKVFQTSRGKLTEKIKKCFVYINLFLFFIVLIIIAVRLAIISFRLPRYILKFMRVSKSHILQIANFDTTIELFNEMPSRYTSSNVLKVLKIIKWTVASHLSFFIFFILIYSTFEFNKHCVRIEGELVYDIINRSSIINTLPIGVLASFMAFRASNMTHYFYFIDEISYTVDRLMHLDYLKEYLDMIPQALFVLVSNSIFNLTVDPNPKKNIEYITNYSNIFLQKLNTYFYFNRYITERFIVNFFMTIFIYCISIYVTRSLSSVMDAELTAAKTLYKNSKKHIHLNEENGNNEENHFNEFEEINIDESSQSAHLSSSSSKHSSSSKNIMKVEKNPGIDLSDLPMGLFVVDIDSIIIFATKMAISEFKLEIGKSFVNSGIIDLERVSSIQLQILEFAEKTNGPTLAVIPTVDQRQSIIMKAHYFWVKKEMKLKNVSICFEGVQYKIDRMQNMISNLFYKIFPKFVKNDSNEAIIAPIELQPKLKSFMIIVLKLMNFEEFVENIEVDVFSQFRSELSSELCELVNVDDNFCKIRETADTIVFSLNRDQNSITVWKVLEVSSQFSIQMMKIVSKLCQKYQLINIASRVMLFKCKEPAWFVPTMKFSSVDWKMDILLNAELFCMYGKNLTVNYSTQKKEMKVPNTTKLKACRTPNGEPFDMFVVV